MSNTTVNAASILRPEQVGALVIEPLTQESVAFQVSTVVQTNSTEYRIPKITGDPASGWVAEGAEIGVDDADLAEVNVVPKKVAGITVITSELAADSSPEASGVISGRLVNSLKRSVDAAWFAAATANGPAGLGSVTPTEVHAGLGPYADTDPFLEAVTAAQDVGATLTSWVTHPDTALALAQLKESDTSNRGLLTPDPTQPTRLVLHGIPLVVSPDAPADGSVWGVPKARAFVVLRKNFEAVLDSSAFFTSDRVAIRATARIGFGFPHEAALVKVTQTA